MFKNQTEILVFTQFFFKIIKYFFSKMQFIFHKIKGLNILEKTLAQILLIIIKQHARSTKNHCKIIFNPIITGLMYEYEI